MRSSDPCPERFYSYFLSVEVDVVEVYDPVMLAVRGKDLANIALPTCVDNDNDGVGSLMMGGLDCDDADPTVWDDSTGCVPLVLRTNMPSTPPPMTDAPTDLPTAAPSLKGPKSCAEEGWWECTEVRFDCTWDWACDAALAAQGTCTRCMDVNMANVACETRLNSDPTGFTSSKWKCSQPPFSEKCQWDDSIVVPGSTKPGWCSFRTDIYDPPAAPITGLCDVRRNANVSAPSMWRCKNKEPYKSLCMWTGPKPWEGPGGLCEPRV